MTLIKLDPTTNLIKIELPLERQTSNDLFWFIYIRASSSARILDLRKDKSSFDSLVEDLKEIEAFRAIEFKIPDKTINKVNYCNLLVEVWFWDHRNYITSRDLGVSGRKIDCPSNGYLIGQKYQLSKSAKEKIKTFFCENFAPIISANKQLIKNLMISQAIADYQININEQLDKLKEEQKTLKQLSDRISVFQDPCSASTIA